jgi:hypothetical protein
VAARDKETVRTEEGRQENKHGDGDDVLHRDAA